MLPTSNSFSPDIIKKPKLKTRLLTNFKIASTFQKVFVLLSLTVLIISLTQPAFYIDREDYDAYASSPFLFFLGWMGILGGSLESLIWFANPIYFIALYLFINDKKLSVVASASTIFLALLFAPLPTILTSESGARSKVTSLELGYKLWVLSFAILFTGTIVKRIVKRKTNEQPTARQKGMHNK